MQTSKITSPENQTEQKEVQKTEDNVDTIKKHPLQYAWTLWYDYSGKRTTANTYASSLKKVYTFDTVEDFWSVYNHILPVSQIPNGSNYRLFKEDIEPKWEDPQNKNGGDWSITFPRKMYSRDIDNIWLDLVLATIGENFEYGEKICGVCASVRKDKFRLEVWTSDAKDEASISKTKEEIYKYLKLKDVKPEYKSHADKLSFV